MFDRALADGFVRSWSAEDVADVLRSIPNQFLAGLTGVFLLGGTTRQRGRKSLTYGLYTGRRIFLCALPSRMLEQHLTKMPKPSVVHTYTRCGATLTPDGKGGARLLFDSASLRRFYLYEVLLHEVGHHLDRDHRSENAERYADWFADFQQARLLDS